MWEMASMIARTLIPSKGCLLVPQSLRQRSSIPLVPIIPNGLTPQNINNRQTSTRTHQHPFFYRGTMLKSQVIASAASSDNEQDEIMEDPEQENDDDSDDAGDDDEDAEGEGDQDDQAEGDENEAENEDGDGEGDGEGDDSQRHPRSRSTTQPPVRPLPTLRPEVKNAITYEITPYVAAPQSTSINAFCATPCMRWVFTGGSDGYIRRFDWFGSINGKVPLTVAQRHPFVDSVTRAGMLLSYWENEEPIVAGKPQVLHVPETTDDLKLSPVYSLAVQNQSLWLLSGLESGGINLQSVRHDEGKIITTLRKHNSAVSVLTLANDEKSVLSGSWDGVVYDWDLNTGQSRREFPSSSGQISSVAFRPISTEWQEIRNTSLINGVSGGRDGGLSNGIGTSNGDGDEDAPGSPVESTRSFGSLFGDDDDDMGMGGEEDEMSRAITNGLGSDPVPLGDGSEDQRTNNGDAIMADDVTRIHTNETSGTRNGSTNGGLGTTNGFLPPASTNGPPSSTDQNVFLASSMDGTLRIWDIREPNPVAVSTPSKGVPPWCMNSCWSTNGNFIYAGRRNGTVEEFSVYKGIGEATRTMKFPLGSGPVSALTALPNGRHLICASFDNLRLYDLSENASKHSTVPFYIIPGHHGGVISSLYVDATGQYLISIAGNRGWEGVTTEVLLGYEIVSVLS